MSERMPIAAELRAVGVAGPLAYAVGHGETILVRHDDTAGARWDLASLTKPLFAAPAYLRRLGDDEPLAALPRRLLTHTAGLPAEIPPREAAGQLAQRVDSGSHAADEVVYSDLGYWYLGRLIEERARLPLVEVYRGFLAQLDVPNDAFSFGTAPAERSVDAGPVRDGRRLVHDPSARRLGGVCGHAGAFGTLDGVIALLGCWLRGEVLSGDRRRDATHCQTHAIPGGHRSLCWTLAGDPFHPVAHDWPGTTLAHTGFTGVSVAWDPGSGWWAVLLTNALPTDGDARVVLRARRVFHASAVGIVREHAAPIGADRERWSHGEG